MNGGEARLQDYGVSLGAGACPKTRTLEGRSQLSHQHWGETLEYAMWGLWGWASGLGSESLFHFPFCLSKYYHLS